MEKGTQANQKGKQGQKKLNDPQRSHPREPQEGQLNEPNTRRQLKLREIIQC